MSGVVKCGFISIQHMTRRMGGSTFQGARSSMTGGSDFLPHHSLNLSGARFFFFLPQSLSSFFSDLFLRVVIFFLCLFERTLHFLCFVLFDVVVRLNVYFSFVFSMRFSDQGCVSQKHRKLELIIETTDANCWSTYSYNTFGKCTTGWSYALKNKRSLLVLMVPLRKYNIHGTFKVLHSWKSFFRLSKYSLH